MLSLGIASLYDSHPPGVSIGSPFSCGDGGTNASNIFQQSTMKQRYWNILKSWILIKVQKNIFNQESIMKSISSHIFEEYFTLKRLHCWTYLISLALESNPKNNRSFSDVFSFHHFVRNIDWYNHVVLRGFAVVLHGQVDLSLLTGALLRYCPNQMSTTNRYQSSPDGLFERRVTKPIKHTY